ncbi:MAG TPA: cupin domain-containing protein [Chryseolinea sp.]|nr:cupin domain-containing protein [Chryseolinea sp.]
MKFVLITILYFMSLATMAQLKPVNSGVYKWAEHPVTKSDDRESRKILEGTSTHLEYFSIHATTQFPGAKPSTAHTNDDIEECLIIKEGLMKMTVEGKSTVLGFGGVILLMPKQMHSVQNVGDSNLTYYVLRYRSKKKMDLQRGQIGGGTLMLNVDSLVFKPSARGGMRAYFDRPTTMCERFEMHTTLLNVKGPSHNPHSHVETEIVLVLSGKTEMTIDGKEYSGTTGDFYFIESQLMHGVRNASNDPCSYFIMIWK